jgi:hypothetical protein
MASRLYSESKNGALGQRGDSSERIDDADQELENNPKRHALRTMLINSYHINRTLRIMGTKLANLPVYSP